MNNPLLRAGAIAVVLLTTNNANAAIIDYSGATVRGDFDGDGQLDTAVSSPQDDCEKGVVYVVTAAGSSTSWGRSTFGVLGTAACYDRFGASLAAGDLDGDGYDDLVIGVPGAKDAGPSYSGAIQVLYGSASGLTDVGDQLWHQDTVGVQGVAESYDYFGDRVELGDFDCNGSMDVAIGVPREAIGTASDAGAVNVLYSYSWGVSSVDDIWYQGSFGVNGTSEGGDYFGASLAAGNFNGDTASGVACDDLAIGAPLENWGSVTNAGTVYIIDGSSTGLATTGDQLIHQGTPGVLDDLEAYDYFAQYLRAGDFDGDGYAELVVIVPGDVCPSGEGLGKHVFSGTASGVSTTQNQLACNTFGCAIDSGDYSCLVQTADVRGSTASEKFLLSHGIDVVWGDGGADEIRAQPGDDVIFAGSGDDLIVGGGGMDIQIAGYGNDTFVVDRDCLFGPGEVLDGGPGADTVQSHRSRAELLAAGVIVTSVESFQVVAESQEPCEPFPFIGPGIRESDLLMSWSSLPSSNSTSFSTTGLMQLVLVNRGADTLVAAIGSTLHVAGGSSEQSLGPVTLGPAGSTTLVVDLSVFLGGIDPTSIDPSLLDIPVSASITTRSVVTIDGRVAETPSAPLVFGHLENGGSTVVLYREDAHRNIYYGGDLNLYRNSPTGGSNPYYTSVTEAGG